MQNPEQPTDGPPLPPMVEAMLDEGELTRLFADLTACAQVTSIIAKPAEPNAQTMRLATDALVSVNECLIRGAFDFVQLRYAYDGQDWIDTLRRVGNQVKLVRIQGPKLADDERG